MLIPLHLGHSIIYNISVIDTEASSYLSITSDSARVLWNLTPPEYDITRWALQSYHYLLLSCKTVDPMRCEVCFYQAAECGMTWVPGSYFKLFNVNVW